MLPTAEGHWLLCACLRSGSAGRAAWESWRTHVGDPMRALGAARAEAMRLQPLLSAALRRNGVDVDRPLQTLLRVAYLREELRFRAYRRIRRDVLSALAEQGVPTLLLRGAALADGVYDEPALRHCHDIDILVQRDNLSRAVEAVSAIGLRQSGRAVARTGTDVRLQHASGLPVWLHSRPFQLPWWNVEQEAMWSRSQSFMCDGVATRTLSPAHNLLHVYGHAMASPSRSMLVQMCDAWHVIQRYPDRDWDVLVRAARRSHLALPMYVVLQYLTERLDAPIPSDVLAALRTVDGDLLARAGTWLGAYAAIWGAWRSRLPSVRGRRARGRIAGDPPRPLRERLDLSAP